MADYSRQIATAKRLIAAKGAPCVWAQANGTVGDPTKPWNETEASPTQNDVIVVFLPTGRQNEQLLRLISGTEIVSGREYGLMAAVDFNPDKTGKLTRTVDGAVFQIESIDAFAPDGTPIFYTLEFVK